MLSIGRLRLTVPPGVAGDPARLARRVAKELARRPPLVAGGEISHLAPPAIEVALHTGQGALAGQVAMAIRQAIERGT